MHALAQFLRKRSTRHLAGALSFLLAAIIVYLSLVQPGNVPAPTVSDKLKHFVAYGALAAPFCVYMGLRRVWLALMLVIALGISMEIAQAFAGTERSASVLDAVANTIGAAMSGLVYWVVMRGENASRATS